TRIENLQDRVDLEMVYELPFIRSSILEERERENALKQDSLSRVKEVIPTDTGTSPVDTLVPLDTSEAIVTTPEKSSIPPPTTTSTTTSSVIVPNRTIDVSNPEEDMSEPE